MSVIPDRTTCSTSRLREGWYHGNRECFSLNSGTGNLHVHVHVEREREIVTFIAVGTCTAFMHAYTVKLTPVYQMFIILVDFNIPSIPLRV